MGRHRKESPKPPWKRWVRRCFEIAVKVPPALYYADLALTT
jgi:hypothetical protein